MESEAALYLSPAHVGQACDGVRRCPAAAADPQLLPVLARDPHPLLRELGHLLVIGGGPGDPLLRDGVVVLSRVRVHNEGLCKAGWFA